MIKKSLNLKEWRKSAGLTQAAVAEELNVHKQYISDIERGVRQPGMQIAVAIRSLSGGQVTLDAQIPVDDDKDQAA